MTPVQLTDTELITRVCRGEPALFAELVDRYRNYVFTLVLRFTDNREDAEEIAQDIFVKAYRSLPDFRGESKFSTWLFTITRTTCISFLRKKKLETVSLDLEKLPFMVQNRHSGFKSDGVEQKSKHGILHEALRLLSPDDTQILTLFYQAEQTLDEIGKIMGLESNTVKVKLHRARTRLKETMYRHFREEVNEMYGD